MTFDAVILDVDGVLTETAVLHERAWKEAIDPVLHARGDPRPVSRADYLAHIDGKPRADGLRDMLASRGVQLDPEALLRVADGKNARFGQLLAETGVRVYEEVVPQLHEWRRHGLAIAFVSASRNARHVLRAAGLLPLCDALVDGTTAAEQGLPGKAEMFRAAAARLGAEPFRAVVVEDSVSGVAAAARSGFGLVVGIDRTGGGEALAEAGATRVIRRLDGLGGIADPTARRASELPSALEPDWLDTHLRGRRPVVLLDYDGTLTPIVDRPDDADLDEETREAARELSRWCVVAVVSGRGLDDVAARVGLPGLWYVGSHGFEMRAPDGRAFPLAEAEPAVSALRAAEARLRAELADRPGIVVEPKAFGLAVHYRLASEADAGFAMRRARELAEQTDGLRLHVDLRVVELRPDLDWNKARAIERLLDLAGAAADLPVFIGDGHTDEDAFRALRDRGLGVLVGAPLRPTHARARVPGPAQVRLLLLAITERVAGSGADGWSLRYEGWVPEQEGRREALCTVGNGCFATRGAGEEARADGIRYPGTYLAGGYDRIVTEVRGEVLESEDLVNWPNWLPLTFRPLGGEWLSLDRFEVIDLAQELDLRQGVLRRELRVRDRDGRVTRIESWRFVSMHDPRVAALHWRIVPEGWSGPIEVRSSLDGTVQNYGVERYRALRSDHLVPEGVGHDDGTIWLTTRTRQSRIRMAQLARHRLEPAGLQQWRAEQHLDRVDALLHAEARDGEPVDVEKVVLVATSRDPATSDPATDLRESVDALPRFGALLGQHARRWRQLWRRCDITLGDGHDETNRILRLHIFHLLQVASPHIVDRDVGVPARGLHGEAYRGHVFWDELFIFPFLDQSAPELTRELLMYRYRRLGAARRIARALGHRGAAYPWQSGSSGREESQVLHLNPRSGRWVPDETSRQRHIGLAIAWNVWHYFEATGDRAFLSAYGAEMMLEIARFFASLAERDEALGRWRIRGVVGPDEFHTRNPTSGRPGLDDNAYTNVLAAWCLRAAERALDEISDERARELLDDLGIDDPERARWRDVAGGLRVVFDGHLISQFDGYSSLKELDWAGYRARYGDIHRLDRILDAEGDSADRYKVSKQADVLMLFYLFRSEDLADLLHSMGYAFETSWIAENVDYYLQRTSDGSTLSSVVHAWVLARSDRACAWRLFGQALRADVDDVQGGTTSEGIHLGAMAGTVDLVKRGFTGASIRDGVLWLDPRLPDELRELRTRFRVRNAWLDVRITHAELEVCFATGHARVARVGFAGRIHEMARGERHRFTLEPAPGASGA